MVDGWSFFVQRARALIYPAECVLCGHRGEADQDLCGDCRRELPWNSLACPRCALPLPLGTPTVHCARCQQQPPPFDHGWAAFRYTGAIRWLHRQLKFKGRLAQIRLLGNLLTGALGIAMQSGDIQRPDRLLFVPLHAQRLRGRGFNQSLELIRPAAKRLDLNIDLTCLRRLRATGPQSDLPLLRRRQNVRGVFACEKNLAGESIAVFDDVITSGETLAEIARVLRRAGAHEISVWSLARTPESRR